MLPLILALTIAAPAQKEGAKEPPSIVGEWIGATGIRDGKPKPPPPGTAMIFEKEGALILTEGGKAPEEKGTYKLDPKKSPAEMDLSPPGKERTMLAIYKIEGDTLTIAFSMGNDRPKEFASPAGSGIMLITLKRAAKK